MQIKNVIIGLLAATSMALTGCGDDGGGGSAACNGDITDTITLDMACSALGAYDLVIPVTVSATVETQPASGDTFEVCVGAAASLGADIADLILTVGGGQSTVVLSGFVGSAAVTGATTDSVPLSLEGLPQTIDFDPDGDGSGNAVDLEFDGSTVTLTNDGSASTDFTIGELTVDLTEVPLLDNLTINVPAMMGDDIVCTLPDPLPIVSIEML